MTADDAARFEANPDAERYIRLRHWDDQAKEINRPVGNIFRLKAMALRNLTVRGR